MKLSTRVLLGLLLVVSAGAALPAGAEIAGSVFDSGGRPIAAARVAAYAAEPSAARAERLLSGSPERAPATGGSGALVAVTDAAGRFELTGEPDQLFFLEAVAEGYVPNQAAVLPDDTEAVLILEEGVEVAGRVLGDGAPVAAATVVWTRREGHDVVARSDAAGRFAFTAPRAGAVAGLLVFHPGFAPFRADRELAPGQPIVLERGRPVVGVVADPRGRPVAGATLAVDGLPAGASGEDGRFALDRVAAGARRLRAAVRDRVGEAAIASGEVEVVVAPAGRIEGTVRLERSGTRRGLAGVAVTVHPLEGDRFGAGHVGGPLAQPLVVVAGAGGRYAADGLPPGRYALQPLLGLERRVRQAEPVIRAAGAVESPAVELHGVDPHVVVLAAGERVTRDLDLVLPPAVRGRVVDAAGWPVAGAAVAVVPEREASAHLAFDPEGPRTDAAGRFEIPLLWIGGPQRFQVVVARRAHSPARSAPFALEPAGGGPARDLRVDVRLPPEAPLRVSVTGGGGASLAGARVAFLLQEGGWGRQPPVEMLLDAPGAAVVTSAEGVAELHLAPGAYRLAAAADGYQTLVHDLELRGGGASTLELALEPAVEIVGRVLRGGRPVPNVHIHLAVPTRFDEPLRTGPDGVFRIPNLPPGEHRLVFVADEGSLHEERTVVAPSRDFVLELPPAGSLSLLVTGRDTGEPVADVAVEVQASDADPAAPRRPRWHHGDRGGRGGGGRIEVAAVPAGEVEVLIGAPGYLPSGPHRVTVRADRATELAVALDPGAELTGTVSGDGGRPLPARGCSPCRRMRAVVRSSASRRRRRRPGTAARSTSAAWRPARSSSTCRRRGMSRTRRRSKCLATAASTSAWRAA